ncbi:MAG: hypothetical protein Kow0031_39460 [Anaerolineae bacterium]
MLGTFEAQLQRAAEPPVERLQLVEAQQAALGNGDALLANEIEQVVEVGQDEAGLPDVEV